MNEICSLKPSGSSLIPIVGSTKALALRWHLRLYQRYQWSTLANATVIKHCYLKVAFLLFAQEGVDQSEFLGYHVAVLSAHSLLFRRHADPRQ